MKKAYIIIFYDLQSPSSSEEQEIINGMSRQIGLPVELINTIKVNGPMPTSPDDHVIATCLLNLEQKNIPFDSERDQIKFRSGMGLGVATIIVEESIAKMYDNQAVVQKRRETIKTPNAPAAIGPYSQAIKTTAGKMIFTAGQIPLDPATGRLIEGDISTQTRRALENVKAILDAAGAKLENVVKTTVFMADLGEFAAMNEVYGEYFPVNPPARSTIEVKALPRGAKVEIETIAIVE